jgi:glycosyltransferase involved in cell wall biosynthesis
MKITFILHNHQVYPGGGPKIVYQYANGLEERGHLVTVVHPFTLQNQETLSTMQKLKYWARSIGLLGGYKPGRWFQVNQKIRMLWVPTLHERWIPDGDVVIATYWKTAEFVNTYKQIKGNKYYLIQHDEVIFNDEDPGRVRDTWRLPLMKIVIAKWLQQIASDIGEYSCYIPNGLDSQKFSIDIPIDKRIPTQLIMMYHPLIWKGVEQGLSAVYKAKRIIPEISLSMFGIPSRPISLPTWVRYYHNPSQIQLRQLYNTAAIYIGPSLTEGWGLTGCEAAQCGNALCLTDIGGHREYGINGVTALLSEPYDSDKMCDNIIHLIRDSTFRKKVAENANEHVKRFTWGKSIEMLEKLLLNKLVCS